MMHVFFHTVAMHRRERTASQHGNPMRIILSAVSALVLLATALPATAQAQSEVFLCPGANGVPEYKNNGKRWVFEAMYARTLSRHKTRGARGDPRLGNGLG